MPLYLGIDYGRRRIGLAISDASGLVASPLTTLDARGRLDEDARHIVELAGRHGVEQFVVGLPTNMDGTEGPQARLTRRFAARLAELAGRDVHLQDERLTTWGAERLLDQAGLSSTRRKARRDAVAAQIMLQAYLDAHRP